MRTNRKIVFQTNSLARKLLKLQGFEVPDGYCFYSSDNPRGKLAWEMARQAQLELTDTDPDDAVAEVLEEAMQTATVAESVETKTPLCAVYRCMNPAVCELGLLGDWAPFCGEHAKNRNKDVPSRELRPDT